MEDPTPAVAALTKLLELYADRAGEAAWLAGLSMLERAGIESREGIYGRWRHYPRGELRRVRREVSAALQLLRVAVALQEAENASLRALNDDLHARAQAKARKTRRHGTREAERVRLLRAQCRREGREPTDDELYPWLAE